MCGRTDRSYGDYPNGGPARERAPGRDAGGHRTKRQGQGIKEVTPADRDLEGRGARDEALGKGAEERSVRDQA